MMTKNNSGYIALISSLVISILLMAIVFALSLTSFSARSNALDAEYKEKSSSLSEACANAAILRLANDTNYNGNEMISIGNDICKILAIENFGTQKIIKTQAVFNNSYTDFKITATPTSNTIIIDRWEEMPNF